MLVSEGLATTDAAGRIIVMNTYKAIHQIVYALSKLQLPGFNSQGTFCPLGRASDVAEVLGLSCAEMVWPAATNQVMNNLEPQAQ